MKLEILTPLGPTITSNLSDDDAETFHYQLSKALTNDGGWLSVRGDDVIVYLGQDILRNSIIKIIKKGTNDY